MQEKVSRCYIEAWSVTEALLTEFRMPFVQRSGEYAITFCMAAYDESGKAEIFVDMEQVRRGHLQARLELCGARQVLIHSFPVNDPNNLAGKFLGRVMKKMGLPGKRSYQRGYTNTIFPDNDYNPDENTIYDELKGLQQTQADDDGEVRIRMACIDFMLLTPSPAADGRRSFPRRRPPALRAAIGQRRAVRAAGDAGCGARGQGRGAGGAARGDAGGGEQDGYDAARDGADAAGQLRRVPAAAGAGAEAAAGGVCGQDCLGD